MPGVRESYNAKGRLSTAGSTKKGKIKKYVTQENGPEGKEEKETAKKEKLLEEVQTSYFFKKLVTKPFSQLAAQSEGNGQARKRGGWKSIL